MITLFRLVVYFPIVGFLLLKYFSLLSLDTQTSISATTTAAYINIFDMFSFFTLWNVTTSFNLLCTK